MPQPLVIAHRGASWDEPENTLRAFRRAIEIGADYVEFDVRATRDGVPVVTHDPILSSFGDLRRRKPDVPTLAEVLEECSGRIGLAIDIKRHDVTRRTLASLKEHEVDEGSVLVVSFSQLAIVETRRLRPDIRTIQHVGRASIGGAAAYAWGIGLSDRRATAAAIRQAQRHGLASTVFTVNTPERVRALTELGVTGIFTDRPDMMRTILRARA